jgi:hypothetical protein
MRMKQQATEGTEGTKNSITEARGHGDDSRAAGHMCKPDFAVDA